MRISDWSSDVCSSDLIGSQRRPAEQHADDNQSNAAADHSQYRIAQPAFRGKPPSRALGILAALRGTCVPCCADGRKGFTVRGYGLARRIMKLALDYLSGFGRSMRRSMPRPPAKIGRAHV